VHAVNRVPRIAVLASGRGSNLQALIDAVADGRLVAQLVGVFSDRQQAPALARARVAGIPARARDAGGYASRAQFDSALFEDVAAAEPDIVVCAGYLRLLGAHVVESWQGRLVNIHPSLLPAFKGLRTHARALAERARNRKSIIHRRAAISTPCQREWNKASVIACVSAVIWNLLRIDPAVFPWLRDPPVRISWLI